MEEDDEDETIEQLLAEAELSRRIAEYLRINGFENLAEAAARGWGDTRPLRKETIQ
jgi:hypothetical protein